MKILRVIDSLNDTEAARQAYRISKELEKNRIESPIFTTASFGEDEWVNVKEFKAKLSFLGLAPGMKKAIIEEQPDIIHAHNLTYQTELARKCAKKLNIPLVISSHGSFFKNHIATLFRKAIRDASAVIVSSETEYNLAIEYADKLHVIPNGLDVDEYIRMKKISKHLRILTGTDDLEEIFESLKGMDAELRIMGESVMELRDDKLKVSFTSEEIKQELSNADVFISKNHIIEAGAAGVPVITKDCWLAREIIDNGITGYILDDFSDLKKYITKTKKMGERLHEKVREKFDWEEVMMDYERLYAKIKGL
ncbi:MAG: glycosyltransferase family 4 protein [Nanobdellota archaeon]